MRAPPLLFIPVLLGLALASCKKAEPVPPAKPVAQARPAPAAPSPRERPEYTDMPSSPLAHSVSTEQAYAAEAQRGGPRGEARIFENPQEQGELSRGSAPKYMNGQFRYYLVSVTLVQPQGECQQQLLAVSLAIENLHGSPTAAIHGEFTFSQVVGGEGSSMSETVAVPYRADILGPFSNKHGGMVYAVAYLETTDPARDGQRWAQIAAISPQRLKVWFKPEVFYYADGTQYSPLTGKTAAQREVRTCGGTEGSRALLK